MSCALSHIILSLGEVSCFFGVCVSPRRSRQASRPTGVLAGLTVADNSERSSSSAEPPLFSLLESSNGAVAKLSLLLPLCEVGVVSSWVGDPSPSVLEVKNWNCWSLLLVTSDTGRGGHALVGKPTAEWLLDFCHWGRCDMSGGRCILVITQ